MTKKGSIGAEGHPLFPQEEGEDPYVVEWIQVVRHDNGRPKMIPRAFRAHELVSLDQISTMWGGGLYELIARRASKHDPTAMGNLTGPRVRYEIPGASRPLHDGPDGDPPAAAPTIAAPVPGQVAAPVDTSFAGMFMQMQLQMMAMSRESAKEAAEAQRRADERAREESRQNLQFMAQLMGQMNQSSMAVVTAVIGSKGSSTDEFAKLITLARDMTAGPKPEAEGGGDIMTQITELTANVADAVQGAVKLREVSSGPPVPGTAASLLEGKKPGEPG